MAVDYLIVAALGALVGTGELVGRYRDSPGRALLSVPAGLYVGVNVAAGIAALALVRAFDWRFGAEADGVRWVQVLVAGLGAMALFRSSLFVVRAGDQDVGIGPSGLLQAILTAADRAVDRRQARSRAQWVSVVMRNVSFEKAQAALPAYCFALMQNVAQKDQDDFGTDVKELRGSRMDEYAKVLSLGLALMNIVGPIVLQTAVETLGETISRDGQPAGRGPGRRRRRGTAPAPPVPEDGGGG